MARFESTVARRPGAGYGSSSMHLPDGIVTEPSILVGLGLTAAAAVGAAMDRAVGSDARRAAWTGTLAAFVLAAQAINVPLLGGASAHVVGAALLTLVVGPARSIVALSAVLIVQALLLADGGLTALGVNVLNLAVIPCAVVHACRRALPDSRRGITAAAVLGTTLGSTMGATSLATVLAYGAAAPPGATYAWLVGTQALVGLVEGGLTAVAVNALGAGAARARTTPRATSTAPAALDQPGETTTGRLRPLVWVAAVAGLAVAFVPLSSERPDALEVVIDRLQVPR